MSLNVDQEDKFIILNKNFFNSSLTFVNIYHDNSTIWCDTNNKCIEIINNEKVVVMSKCPYESTNMKHGEFFNTTHAFKKRLNKQKNNDKIILTLKGNNLYIECDEKIKNNILFDNNNILYSVSNKNENNTKNTEKSKLQINNSKSQCIISLDDMKEKNIYYALDLEKYQNVIGVFQIPHDLINKYFNNSLSIIKFVVKNDIIELISEGTKDNIKLCKTFQYNSLIQTKQKEITIKEKEEETIDFNYEEDDFNTRIDSEDEDDTPVDKPVDDDTPVEDDTLAEDDRSNQIKTNNKEDLIFSVNLKDHFSLLYKINYNYVAPNLAMKRKKIFSILECKIIEENNKITGFTVSPGNLIEENLNLYKNYFIFIPAI